MYRITSKMPCQEKGFDTLDEAKEGFKNSFGDYSLWYKADLLDSKKDINDLEDAVVSISETLYPSKLSKIKERDEERYKQLISEYTSVVALLESNPNKGLLLVGAVGCGKTAFMNNIRYLGKGGYIKGVDFFSIVNSFSLVEEFAEYGFDIFKFRGKMGEPIRNLCIDDLGIDGGIIHRFGGKTNVLSMVIMKWYELFSTENRKLYITTNMAFKHSDIMDSVEDMYGIRVIDRIEEMCSKHVFKGTSLRK